MSVSELSASSQDYLKAVWALAEWSETPVTPKLMADRMGLKLSSVSDAVRKLTEQGFLEHAPYGAVTLTAQGRVHAVAMVRRHRLIETFLVETLGYRWDQVHDEAETLEHAVSDFMIERLAELLGHPDRDPHGDPIPSADGTVARPNAIHLTALAPGQRARVERISDDDPQLLQFFAENGVRYGTVLEAHPSTPYSEVIEVRVEGRTERLALGRAATDAVWVEALT
ncbi:metal-dependent transcriptional regulator [Micrococcus lylae]|uniref:Manganese transport regulator n=1 Tax=Micrococcus lylae TaxID=1273 RepID=A0ABY2JYF1_9MICC|nr:MULTISPECIES: metal-dependent transcriptional regulator [Micrococcus]MCT2007606.1 metal-dependent transcriptional regulator [Micrococcus lylae]MCT2071359.1 metal-dependent transcriptional regulator [Micrococcus lylae]TFH98119.1 metal-dependent transcriptional regulator [Micrococcus lylae]WIK81851.1 metal-dependent transcriptional regulator [Micrococcus lylae]